MKTVPAYLHKAVETVLADELDLRLVEAIVYDHPPFSYAVYFEPATELDEEEHAEIALRVSHRFTDLLGNHRPLVLTNVSTRPAAAKAG